MRLFNRLTLITAGLAFGIAAANAAGIGPGSPAPKLDIKTWYKGTPVKELDKNKIYVVEFWATWCGPCIQTIPHITELAKKNTDVTFIGVGIWEDDNGTNIKQFVEKMGDKMDYNVGYSGNKTGMSVTWMEAASQNGIPAAFIVKNNEIQWIGHPATIDQPLAEVKAGTFDLKAHKAAFDKEAEETRVQMAIGKDLQAARKLVSEKKYAEAKTKLGEIEKQYPTAKTYTESLHFTLLAKQNPSEWEKKAKEMVAKKEPNAAQKLSMFAMEQAAPGGDIALGAKAMDFALEAAEGKDLVTLYNGTMFYSQTKDYKKALPLITKALEIYPSSQFKDNPDIKQMLEKVKADIAAKAEKG